MEMGVGWSGLQGKLEWLVVLLAELWALQDGLLLCLQFHVQAVIIEMDAKAIVDAFSHHNNSAFSHHNNSNSIISSRVDDCR